MPLSPSQMQHIMTRSRTRGLGEQSEAEAHSILRSVRQLLLTANVTSSLFLATRIMEAIRSSETSVITTVTGRNIAEDGILQEMWSLVPKGPTSRAVAVEDQ
jgi:hypothetical protein